MDNKEFMAVLEQKLKGRKLKLDTNNYYVLAHGADDVIWLIKDGIIITERNNSDGTKIGCGVYAPGMLAGITALNGESGVITCKPLKDTVVIGYRTKAFVELMESDIEITRYIIRFLCGRFRFIMNSLEMNSIRSVGERIEFFENTLRSFNDPDIFSFGDSTIAEYLGIHPASISRARRQTYKNDDKSR